MFSTLSRTNLKFSVTFILSSANAFNLGPSKTCLVSYYVRVKKNCEDDKVLLCCWSMPNLLVEEYKQVKIRQNVNIR